MEISISLLVPFCSFEMLSILSLLLFHVLGHAFPAAMLVNIGQLYAFWFSNVQYSTAGLLVQNSLYCDSGVIHEPLKQGKTKTTSVSCT